MVAETESTPEIRFHSFSDEWKRQRLENIFSSSRAKGREGLPTVSVTIDRGLVNRDDLERKQETNLTAKEHLLVRDGDIAYNMMRMWQGAFGRASSEGIVSPAYVVLRGRRDVDTRYFEYAFRRSRSIYLFWAYSYGLTKDRLRLYAKDFTRIPFSAPTLPEQRKIADFLTTVDGRIQQLIQKKVLLEDYKKGVMQQLFTQSIRFKDDHGNDFPDWEEKKLGEVYDYITTNSLSRDKLNYESGEIFNIHYGDIHTKFRSHFYLSKESVPYLNDSAEHLKIKDDCYVKTGDIVLADASEDYADIGKSIEILDTEDQQIVSGLHTYILRPDLSQMATGFGAYLMQARPTRLEVMTVAQGTKVLGLPKGYLADITLKIPTPAEQTKIANFLSAIDRKIESVAAQIAETQTFKRGLLQQMFV